MSANAVTPQQFWIGETVPYRPNGSEAEYDTQIPGQIGAETENDYSLLQRQIVSRMGLATHQLKDACIFWLPSGGNYHPDIKRVEYSSGEGDSPESYVGLDEMGMTGLIRMCAGEDGVEVYRHSGTVIGKKFRTLGYHENLLTTAATDYEWLPGMWDGYQATRVWAWAGMIGREGFELSQKAIGIGHPTSYGMGNRVTEGLKPMGWIRKGDSDVFAEAHQEKEARWMRVESRVVDGLFSRWARYMSAAVGSLVLRFAERQHVFDLNDHPGNRLRLVDPVDTLKKASRDLQFKEVYQNVAGEWLSVANFQELIADYGDILSGRTLLPPSELWAIGQLRYIADRIRQTNISEGDVRPLLGLVDFAPRLGYLLKHFELHQLHGANVEAVAASLRWDRVLPEGPGIRYWNTLYKKGKAPDPIGQQTIDYYYDHPARQGRGFTRGTLIGNAAIRSKMSRVDWPYVDISGLRHYIDPFQGDPATVNSRVVKRALRAA